MQPRARDGLSAAQVTDLIEGDPLRVTGGLDMLDDALSFVEDVSDDLRSGSVTRSLDGRWHGRLSVDIARDLDWPSIRLRPHVTLDNTDVSARFDLGVFLPQIPSTPVGETPQVVSVEADDILARLDVPVADSVEIAASTGVIGKVRSLLDDAGLGHEIAGEADGELLDRAQSWPWSEEPSTLDIINELLDAVGYRSLWSDWHGVARSHPATSAADRGVEWTYDADDEFVSIVARERAKSAPQRRAPNRWVFVAGDPQRDVLAEGDGIYTVDNLDDGPTSQNARGGWVISKVVQFDVANHDALVAKGDEHVEEALRDADRIQAETGPNPLHWHRDVLQLEDPELGSRKLLVTSWTLDLVSGWMQHEWRRA